MSGPNRTLKLSYVGDSSRLNKANAEAQTGLSKLGDGFKKFAKVGAVAFTAVAAAGTAFAVKFGKDAVKSASDLSESVNALQVTFGDAADDLLKLGDAAATTVGLSKSQFASLAVSFAGFTKQIAGDGGDVAGVTDDLTRRIADFASVMNLDLERATQVFQSTLAGSSEVARAYGIDVGAAAVEQFALENGLAASKAEMTEAVKVQARYALIMQETEKVSGDFANTSDGLANSQRILAARMEDVRAKVGEALVPVLASFVTLISEKALPFVEKWGSIIAEKVAPAIAGFAERIREDIIPQVTIFIAKVRDLIDRLREWWQRVSPGVFESFRKLKEPIMELWQNLQIAWGQIKELIGNFRSAESDGQGFQKFIDGLVAVIGLFVKGLTAAVKFTNRLRDALLRLTSSKAFQAALSGLSSIGGAISGGLSRIAGLAEGGIVTRPTLAMVGEGGEPEAVIPLSKMGQMGGGVNITINGAIDPEGVARQIRRILEDSGRRTGATLQFA